MKEVVCDKDKETLYRMIIEFDEYCKLNKLTYFLSWGTLIGAVRHKGFIPWDDDVDIAMPRNDYEKLIELSTDWNCSFDLLCYEKDHTYPLFFGKLSDKKTVIENKYIQEIKNLGLYIDIFPIDNVYISNDKSVKIQKKLMRNELMQKYASMKKYWPTSSVCKSVIKFWLYIYSKHMGTEYWQKKRLCLIERMKINVSDTKADFCICGSWVLKKEWFENSVELPFEKYKLPCPEKYDSFLRYRYGDYMKLPPMEKRVSQHDYKVIKREDYHCE